MIMSRLRHHPAPEDTEPVATDQHPSTTPPPGKPCRCEQASIDGREHEERLQPLATALLRPYGGRSRLRPTRRRSCGSLPACCRRR